MNGFDWWLTPATNTIANIAEDIGRMVEPRLAGREAMWQVVCRAMRESGRFARFHESFGQKWGAGGSPDPASGMAQCPHDIRLNVRRDGHSVAARFAPFG